MRIISGQYKKKKLLLPDQNITRPLRDYVKESIFNYLLHNKDINFNFENSTILDIFSGSGSFGIECLSRGSARVFFVEKNTKAIEVLEKNISSINSKDKCEIINKDILHIDLSNLLHTRVNLIFLDPPFNYELWNELIKKIYLLKKKSPECIIITHQKVKKNIRLDQYLNILLQKKYGVSLINFARFKL